MHLTFAFKFPPLSKKERKRREEIAKKFIGQWSITSDLPFAGNFSIQSDGKNFKGSIEFSKETISGEIKELAQIGVSGEKIVFGITWKRRHQRKRDGKGLVAKELSGDAMHIRQRQKHRNVGQCRGRYW